MLKMISRTWLSMAVVVWGTLILSGCGQQGANTAPESVAHEAGDGHEHEGDHDHGEDGHNLHGYWCVEHGVPEAICGQCDNKLAAEFQQKGDWCEEHNRPDSQCFIHHPELKDKFIAQYEAKFGEKPPKMEVE